MFLRPYIILCFIFLVPFKNYSQSKIDSVENLLNTAKSDSQKVVLLNQLSNLYYKSGLNSEKEKIASTVSEAISIAKKNKFEKGIADALFIRAKSELSYTKVFSEAAIDFIDALQHYENLKDSSGMAGCYMQLGLISYLLQYYEDAVANFSQSLSLNPVVDIQNAVANYLMAISYSELKDTLNGKKFFDKALNVYDKFDFNHGRIECYTYLAKMYVEANDLTKAEKYFDTLYNEKLETNEEQTRGRLEAIHAGFFLKNNEVQKAIASGLSGYKVGKKFEDEITTIEAASVLYKAYNKSGDFKNAFFYLNDLKNLNDSLYNSNTAQRIAEIKSKSSYEKKMLLEKQEEDKKTVLAKKEIEKQKVIRNSILTFLLIAIVFLLIVFIQRSRLSKEKKRSEKLLLNILPAQVAEELKTSNHVHAENYDMVSVMFVDFKDFTKMISNLSAKELVREIDYYFSAFDKIILKYNIEKIKTIGDAYMCASGVPKINPNHAIDLVNAAFEIQHFIHETAVNRKSENKIYFEIRCGIHSGPVVAGVVGTIKFAYDIWGETVNTASRIESGGEPGKINISGSTYDLIKNKFNCTYRGKIQAKHIGEIDMYFVENSK